MFCKILCGLRFETNWRESVKVDLTENILLALINANTDPYYNK